MARDKPTRPGEGFFKSFVDMAIAHTQGLPSKALAQRCRLLLGQTDMI